MKNIARGSGSLISWFSAGFIAICPVCHWLGVFLTIGQAGFLLAFTRILTPLILFFVAVSILSFYVTYRIHGNRWPFILSIGGGLLISYALVLAPLGNVFAQLSGIVLLSSAALVDFNYRFKQVDCKVCKVKTDLVHEHITPDKESKGN